MKETEYQRAELWLRRAVRNAPHPLPPGRFPQLLEEAVRAGFSQSLVNDVVDAKLVKSAANIPGVVTTTANGVNTYDVVNANKLIVSLNAAKKLEEVLG